MLQFLRKYQRFFFLIITVVIVISFSFFGSYSNTDMGTYRDEEAFQAESLESIKALRSESAANSALDLFSSAMSAGVVINSSKTTMLLCTRISILCSNCWVTRTLLSPNTCLRAF